MQPYIRNLFHEITFMLESTKPSKDYTSIRQSDIAGFGSNGYGIWINGTQSALILPPYNSEIPTLPSTEFPFKRLASVKSDDGLTTFLYHQMDGATFAEEQWDDGVGAWSHPELITVSDT